MNKRVIHKVQLKISEGVQEVEFPRMSQIVSVQSQAGIPTIWFSVNKEIKETVIAKFKVVATGEEFEFDQEKEWLKHIGTIQSGLYVFHIIEIIQVPELLKQSSKS